MARGIHRLTVLQVSKAARQGLTLCDGGGLYLQNGSSWIFRYTRNHRNHWLGLGPLRLVDLPAARELAQANRKLLFEGIDPLERRKVQRAAAALQDANSITFDACVAAYLRAHGDGWRSPTHRRAWETSLQIHASPVIGKLPVAAIDAALVLRVLEPIWKEKSVTASRLRGRIERVLGWAGVMGYRDNNIPNPARWKDNIDHLLVAKSAIREVKHHPALPHGEMSDFMVRLHKETGVGARALEFTILCAVRTGDVLGPSPMLWSHVDLERRLWTIPKTKNGTEHRVPLSDAAMAVLEAMRPLRDSSNVVFSGHDKIMLRTLDRVGRSNLTTHGFRATFKTWASECTSYDRDVVEACLTHTISDRLERAYRRGDFLEKRARLMTAWGAFCDGCAVPQGSSTVVSLHA